MIRTLPTLTPSSLYARAATPVFYSADLDYWVVTRDHDIEQIFQTGMFSAANTLASLQPICPAAGRLLAEGGFRPVPTLNRPPRALPNAAARARRLHSSTCRRHGTARPGAHQAIRRRAPVARPGPTSFAMWPGTCPPSWLQMPSAR